MLRLISCIILLFMPGIALSQGIYVNGTDGPIGAATPCTGSLVRSIVVVDDFSIGDVTLDVLATHAWRGDIRLTLQSPQSTRVELISEDTGVSGNIDNYNIRLSDAGGSRVNEPPHDTADDVNATAPENIVRPDNALSAFDGESSVGTWEVEICDAFPGADDGVLLDLSLALTPQTAAPTPTLSCAVGSPQQLAWTATGGAYGWPAGSTATQSYTVGPYPISVSLAGDTANLVARNGTDTPVTTADIGGSGQFVLANSVNYSASTQSISYTLSLGNPGTGFAGVQFDLLDVDATTGAWQDRMEVTASLGGVSVPVILTPTGAANYVNGNAVIGLSPVGTTGPGGEGRVSILQDVDTVTVTYGTGPRSPADPNIQTMAYSLIDFCPPEFAELDAAKTAEIVGGGFAVPGSEILYTLSVTNPGTSTVPADGIDVEDVLPDAVQFVSATPSGFTGGVFNPALPAANTDCAGGTCLVKLEGASLPVGATGEVAIVARLK